MELEAATADTYVRWAFTQIAALAERLGDAKVNERPPGPDTNSAAGIIIHCCGVCEFWLGHVGLGRASTRDRDSEFTATATADELAVAIERSQRQVSDDLRRLAAGEASDAYRAGRAFLQDGDTSDASLVLHVIEELFQHLGQIELTADALAERGGS